MVYSNQTHTHCSIQTIYTRIYREEVRLPLVREAPAKYTQQCTGVSFGSDRFEFKT
jgi:hypothetical protein